MQGDAHFDHLPIDELPLSSDTAAALRRHAVFTVGDLRRWTLGEVAALAALPDGALREIEDGLASCGLSLSSRLRRRRPALPFGRVWMQRRTLSIVCATAALVLAAEELLEGASLLT
jgi:hypothetical protein